MLLIRTIPPYWSTFLANFHMRVGNPDTEEEFLKSRSPLFKADQIKIPMLIAQGANDPRVKQAESEQIVAAMKEKGISYEYMLFPDEGHGFAKPREPHQVLRRGGAIPRQTPGWSLRRGLEILIGDVAHFDK